MAAQHMRLCVPCINILAIWILIHMIVTVRSVCLSDAISFYASDKACGFYRTDFAKVFIDSNKGCFIDCSVDSQPSYKNMSSWKHELTEMTIHFVSTTHPRQAILKKFCLVISPTNTKITITCKLKERQSKRCVDEKQCADVTHSTCNQTSGLCQCVTGYYYMWKTNACVTARGIGESCNSSIQCEAETPYSTCDTDKICRCQLGYLELNKSCSLGRQLNESCNDSLQCSAINPNATCGKTSGVCECTEGLLAISNRCINDRRLGEQCEDHIQCKAAAQHSICNKENECRCQEGYREVNDSCVSVQILLDEIRRNFENCSFSSGGCEQNEIERVCNSITKTSLKHLEKDELYEVEKNDNSSVVIGVGVVCLSLGAAIGGLVYFIITLKRRKTKLRSGKLSDDTTKQLSVQVSQNMNSRLVYNQDTRGIQEGNDVYNHLHQDPIEVNVQSDYDHAPQQMTAEDDYSHMNTCNKTPVQEPDYYGELN